MSDALGLARAMDASDELGRYRSLFVGCDSAVGRAGAAASVASYLDGNSLGRPLTSVSRTLADFVTDNWGGRLIRGWDEEWMQLPTTIGDELARAALGAAPGQTLIGDSTTVLLYKAIRAAVDARPGRTEIVIDSDNFPTDRYLVEGIAAERGLALRWIDTTAAAGTTDTASANVGGITPELLSAAVGPATAVVVMSHVAYRTGYLADLCELTRIAHAAGALIVADLCHAAGSVPIALDAWDVDIAVGCSYKYLNGGPGAPAYLYVKTALQSELRQPIWGWLGHTEPFAMGPGYTPAAGIRSFQSGTPPVIGMLAMREMISLVGEAGIDRIRAKSVALTELTIALADEWLAPLGVAVASPRTASERGSHVTLDHPLFREVIAELWQGGVLPDFRAPQGLRVGLSPLSTSFTELVTGLAAVRESLHRRVAEPNSGF